MGKGRVLDGWTGELESEVGEGVVEVVERSLNGVWRELEEL